MARHPSDREDLLREATALVERVELSVPRWTDTVVAGFRRDGCASFYFGGDPVYQFNTSCELRRAYCAGLMIKAEHGRLVSLERRRSGGQVQLVRHELTDQCAAEMVSRAAGDLEVLRLALAGGEFHVLGQEPPEVPVATRVRQWLDRLGPITLARSPGAR